MRARQQVSFRGDNSGLVIRWDRLRTAEPQVGRRPGAGCSIGSRRCRVGCTHRRRSALHHVRGYGRHRRYRPEHRHSSSDCCPYHTSSGDHDGLFAQTVPHRRRPNQLPLVGIARAVHRCVASLDAREMRVELLLGDVGRNTHVRTYVAAFCPYSSDCCANHTSSVRSISSVLHRSNWGPGADQGTSFGSFACADSRYDARADNCRSYTHADDRRADARIDNGRSYTHADDRRADARANKGADQAWMTVEFFQVSGEEA